MSKYTAKKYMDNLYKRLQREKDNREHIRLARTPATWCPVCTIGNVRKDGTCSYLSCKSNKGVKV